MHPALERARDRVEAWCQGRSGLVRLPLLAWLVYLAARHLSDADYGSIIEALNLGIHEAGHLLFSWFPGQFVTTAGGTLLQIAAPVASAVMFMRQPDYFAVSFCGGWLATNLYGIARYAADARAQDLPLVTVGGGECEVCHDWEYMLSAVGLLQFDTKIAALIRLLAFLVIWGSIAAGAWMVWRMARSKA